MILFARNYESPQQLSELTAEVQALRSPRLLIAIDHEGGRVQRCRDGFTRLPPMQRLGELWDANPQSALKAAQQIGYVLAAELLARGVDLSLPQYLISTGGIAQSSEIVHFTVIHASSRAWLAS